MAEVRFDRSPLKVGQVILMTGLVAGWAIALVQPRAAIVLPVLSLMLLGGAYSAATSLPRAIYAGFLSPRGLVRPRVHVEDPAPHRFAQLVGGIFLAAGSIAAVSGLPVVAWTLGWIVVALAFLNFAFDICVGCIMYAQLVRVGLFPITRHRTAPG